jgi:hypothetical protein
MASLHHRDQKIFFFNTISYSNTIQYLYLLHMRFQFRAKHTNDLVSEWFRMAIQEIDKPSFRGLHSFPISNPYNTATFRHIYLLRALFHQQIDNGVHKKTKPNRRTIYLGMSLKL